MKIFKLRELSNALHIMNMISFVLYLILVLTEINVSSGV